MAADAQSDGTPATAGVARTRAHAPGECVDGYTLESLIHLGGMAEIWRVHHPDLEMPAVMKIPVMEDDLTAIVSFEVEQMILPLLRGPHTPAWIASGSFERQPYLVMEQLPGPSLRSRLDALPLDCDTVASIGTRVAQALHALHSQGVMHFDLKPSNVLFRPDGSAVLIDFGLARHDRLPDLLAEQFRLPMGTGPYMSPEQVLQDRSRLESDIFSLGVILYYLATGERPFGAPISLRGLRERLHESPEPPRKRCPQVPPWLQEVILRCLEIDPRARYSSAAQLAFDLSHPECVAVTERAHRLHSASWFRRQTQRWMRRLTQPLRLPAPASVALQIDQAPIIMAAVDLTQEWEAQAQALRRTTARIMQIAPRSRLACVTVIRPLRPGRDNLEPDGAHPHVQRLVHLQHWARPLGLATDRISYHVLEHADPAEGILGYANNNRVAHIVIGSRGASTLRRYLGSVSTQVVAQSACSVTVVKIGDGNPQESPAPGEGPTGPA